MLNLPLALRQEKNKLAATAPWLILLQLTLPDSSVMRFVRNNEDVPFGGEVYTALAFDLGDNRSSGDGSIQGVSLKVANPARVLEPYLEAHDGLIGCRVTMLVVHADNLGSDYSELTLSWDILSASTGSDWITFNLGAENPFRRRFPLQVAIPYSCNWPFKGRECSYVGPATACARTLDACRSLANSARFGGRPGIVGATRFVGV